MCQGSPPYRPESATWRLCTNRVNHLHPRWVGTISPTVRLDPTMDARGVRDEAFGLVLVIQTFKIRREALAIANEMLKYTEIKHLCVDFR